MPTLRPARPCLAGAVQECRDVLNSLAAAANGTSYYKEECMRLAKSTKRLVPLLDDLYDNVVDPTVEQKGIVQLKASSHVWSLVTLAHVYHDDQCASISSVFACRMMKPYIRQEHMALVSAGC